MSTIRLIAALVLALTACEERAVPAPAPATQSSISASPSAMVAEPQPVAAGNAERGRTLVERFECHRCHEGTGLTALPSERHCVRCHQEIEGGKVSAPAEKLAEWKRGIAGVSHVPSLDALGRLKREWLEGYLQEPHDLRPALVSTMPRLALSSEEGADIVAYLQARGEIPTAPERPATGDVKRGRELAMERGCASCHAFSGVADWPAARGNGAAVELATDLRFARERLAPETTALWLRDPKRLKPTTLMPKLGLGDQEISDLVAFVTRTPLTPRTSAAPPRLALLERQVSFAEVDKQVFSVTCRHCHSNTETGFGDGGPGFDGGFGFAPRRVDLSSHRGISSGLLAADGERHSLFEKLSDGTPRLVAALLARQAEEGGRPSQSVRGMPLGLPSLTPEQIQLVETWVAQGHPL
ncbi:MAG TPA: cytochrome c [Polyangiaceae bacterium]|nr:cytochrome c [Polyangiaceae bacterium]